MYIIVAGAGDLGTYLTKLLQDEGHDVIVIDKNQARCESIVNELNVEAVNDDATNPKTMDKVNAQDADALVALTESDETNMVISLLAKEKGVKTVATRIERIEYDENILKRLGIDLVIHPKAAAAGYIAELVTNPEVLDLVFLSRGEAVIMELAVKKGSQLDGKKVKEAEHPSGSAIIAIVTGEKLTIPSPDEKIKAGDKVIVIAKKEVADLKWSS